MTLNKCRLMTLALNPRRISLAFNFNVCANYWYGVSLITQMKRDGAKWSYTVLTALMKIVSQLHPTAMERVGPTLSVLLLGKPGGPVLVHLTLRIYPMVLVITPGDRILLLDWTCKMDHRSHPVQSRLLVEGGGLRYQRYWYCTLASRVPQGCCT